MTYYGLNKIAETDREALDQMALYVETQINSARVNLQMANVALDEYVSGPSWQTSREYFAYNVDRYTRKIAYFEAHLRTLRNVVSLLADTEVPA